MCLGAACEGVKLRLDQGVHYHGGKEVYQLWVLHEMENQTAPAAYTKKVQTPQGLHLLQYKQVDLTAYICNIVYRTYIAEFT